MKLNIPLRVDYGDVRTVLSAERVIRRLSVDLRWYGPDHPSAGDWAKGIEDCAQAIEATTGESVPTIMERLSDAIERSFTRQEKEADKHWKQMLARNPYLDAQIKVEEVFSGRNF